MDEFSVAFDVCLIFIHSGHHSKRLVCWFYSVWDCFNDLSTILIVKELNNICSNVFYSGGPTVIMAILARLGVNISANIGFQYAAEMLPTVVRAQGVSLIHIIGYFAHIIGPYIVYLVR